MVLGLVVIVRLVARKAEEGGKAVVVVDLVAVVYLVEGGESSWLQMETNSRSIPFCLKLNF